MLIPNEKHGVAHCDIRVHVTGTEDTNGVILAKLNDKETSAELVTFQPLGAGIKIRELYT